MRTRQEPIHLISYMHAVLYYTGVVLLMSIVASATVPTGTSPNCIVTVPSLSGSIDLILFIGDLIFVGDLILVCWI